MEEQRTANVVLTADVDQYQQGMAQASATTTNLAKNIDAVTTKLGELNKRAGKGLVGFGAGITAGLTAATMSASKFEKQLSTLQAQSVVANKNFGLLRNTTLELSKQFPISLTQATQLITSMNQMGIQAESAIGRMASSLVKLSGATGADLIAVSTGLLELGRTMGTINTNNVEKYANALTNVHATSGVAADSVLALANNIAPVARLAGMTENQVIGLAGAFTKAGADGYAGATAFNRVVYGLTRTLQFGGPEMKTYADLLGMTSQQIQNMDPAEAVIKMFESLNTQGPMAIKTLDSLGLDGLRTIKSIQAVIQSGDLRETYEAAISGPRGSLDKGSEAAFSGLSDSVQKMGTQFQQLGISIGENFIPPVNAAVQAVTQLGSALTAISKAPVIGTVMAWGSAALGGVAGTLGMGMLGARALSTVVGVGMAGGLARSAFGGFRLGQGASTPAALRAGQIIGEGNTMRPSNWLARTGFMLGGYFGPRDGQEPGYVSRAMAMPFRAGGWLADQQSKFVKNSELMQGAMWRNVGRSFMDVGRSVTSPLSDLGKQFGRNAQALQMATRETVGFSQAMRNFGGSMAAMGLTYGRGALAAGGMALRGAGGLAMAALGGPVGMAVMGGVGGLMLANWAGGLAARRTEDWGTLAANNYLEASGQSALVSSAYTLSPLEKSQWDLPAAGTRRQAAAISPGEAELAGSLDYKYVEPAMANMSEASARGLVMSMGYMNPEQMQMVGQDLTARFGAGTASQILQESVNTFAKNNSARVFLNQTYADDIIRGISTNQSPFFRGQRQTPGANPFSGENWRVFFGGLPDGQAEQYETAVEQIGTEVQAIVDQYGAQAGNAAAINRMYETLAAVPAWDQAGRNKLESLFAEKYGVDFNYPGIDFRDISGEDIQAALAGARFNNNKTGEDIARSAGYTLTGAEGYTALDLSNRKDRRDFSWAQVEQTKTYSAFQLTELGKLFDKAGVRNLAASEAANDQIKVADKLLAAADKTGDTLGSLSEAEAQAPQTLIPAFKLAQQLEQRRFDQSLGEANFNRWTTQNMQYARTRQQIGSLDPDSETYREDLLALEDQAFQQRMSIRESYEQVILARRQFNVSMERSAEEYQISVERSETSFYRQREWSQEDFHRNQLRAEQDFNRSMSRMVEDSMSQVYDPYSRITTQPTLDAQNLIINIREQNQALQDQEKNLKRLRRAGVDQATVDFLGLADPKNAQQLARLVADIRNDPRLLRELNKLTEQRERGTEVLVGSHWSRQYRRAVDDFERQSRRAREDFNRQMARNNVLFNEGMQHMQEDHERMMENAQEDFELAYKEVTGNFRNIEQRALNILANAGVKVVSEGERQMDRIMSSLTRKYNFTQRMIDRLIGMGGSGGGGAGGSSGGGPGGGPGFSFSQGVTETRTFGGADMTIKHAGSSSVAPTFAPANRYEATKLNRNEKRRLSKREKFLEAAYSKLGHPYVFGAEGPDKFDCSGLTQWAAAKAGISIPRIVSDQYARSRPKSMGFPGDIVVFDNSQPYGKAPMNHVGIYVGGGKMIHAPRPGSNIGVASIYDQGFEWKHFASLPGMAKGGIAKGMAIVGEGEHPETVIPLNHRGHAYMMDMYKTISREMVKEMVTKQLRVPATGAYGGAQYINASTNITGDITVKADDPRMMLKKLEAEKRRANLLSPQKAKS